MSTAATVSLRERFRRSCEQAIEVLNSGYCPPGFEPFLPHLPRAPQRRLVRACLQIGLPANQVDPDLRPEDLARRAMALIRSGKLGPVWAEGRVWRVGADHDRPDFIGGPLKFHRYMKRIEIEIRMARRRSA